MAGMSETRKSGSTVVPSVRYKDAHAAIAWLVDVLGFDKHAVYEGPDGTVAHAQLTFGATGMVMLGSAANASERPEWNALPSDIGGRVTSPLYLVVKDCDPLHAKAKAAGADFVQEMATMDYGGRAFTVRDPEGYMWSVGEYDPWKSE